MRPPVIEARDVWKTYRNGTLEVDALRGVSFTIDAGEYVAIMGPSGSGKSTLMHILGCLDVATSGTFLLAGEDVSAMSEEGLAHIRNRRIGFVFQQFNLLASLSAWRNVELPLVYAGVDRAARKSRSLEALDRVGLADRVEHRPGELSGGQQQRVAVARALVTDPALILADEPTGNLDSVAASDVLGLLDELHAGGRTIVLITHEADVANAAERTIRIRDGQIFDAEPDRQRGRRIMNVLETFRTGIEAVVTHRLRSSLTVLGIMIGIAAVILTVGLGEGAQHQVSSQISALGTNLLTISPGSTTSSSGIRGGFGSASTLTVGDAAALTSKTVAPDIGAVAPTTSRSETLVAGTTNWTTTVVGTNPSWLTVRGRSMTEGRFIAGHDLTTRADVVVLGSTTAQELFGLRDAIGQPVTINGLPMTVIGVLNTVGSSGSSGSSTTADQDDQAIVPITTAATQLFGGTNRNTVGTILVQATSSSTLSAAYQEADRRAGQPAPDHHHRRCRLHHHPGDVPPEHGHLGGQDAHRPARGHRRHLAAGRRHRCDEHHAGFGDRADPRDRVAQGTGCDPAGHPSPVPGRGVGPRSGRGNPRRRPRADRRGGASSFHLRPDRHLAGGHRRGHRRRHRHRRRLRGLPGRPGRPLGPHRCPAQRMTRSELTSQTRHQTKRVRTIMTIASKPSTPTGGGADPARGSERSARFRRAFALSALGLAAVTLAACGSSSAASSTSSTARPSNTVRATGRRRNRGGAGTAAATPGAFGHHRRHQWGLSGGAESDHGTDDGHLHPDHYLRPDGLGLRLRGDRRVVHLRRSESPPPRRRPAPPPSVGR